MKAVLIRFARFTVSGTAYVVGILASFGTALGVVYEGLPRDLLRPARIRLRSFVNTRHMVSPRACGGATTHSSAAQRCANHHQCQMMFSGKLTKLRLILGYGAGWAVPPIKIAVHLAM